MTNEIESIVKESPDIVTALESIAPMYGIPADHILEDATIKSIKVVGDHIIAPSDVKPNTKSIVCAIGGVLDYISQRVDDKVSNYQNDIISKGRIEDHIKRDSNPSKGTVIARYVDANGDEILAYDSGLVDMASTKEAIAKVNELRQNMQIPMYNPDAMKPKATYFTDEDDISVPEPRSEKFRECDVTNMSNVTSESALILDKIAHFGDTTHLGYEWMQEQGFDFVKPVDVFIQESKKEKVVKPGDIKHMKFDNTHILKAIKYFNEARDKQSDKGKGEWDIHAFINTPEYNKAINELDLQFDCKLNIKWLEDKEFNGNQLTAATMNDIKHNLTISKTKGFQMNGQPVEIWVINKAIDEEMQKNTSNKLFGQFVCASICHEIFHHIASVIRCTNTEFRFTLNSALALATSTPIAENRRVVFERFVSTLASDGIKLNPLQKKKLVKDLCYITALAYNEKALREIKGKLEVNDEANKEIDSYIKVLQTEYSHLQKLEKKHESHLKHPVAHGILTGIGVLLTCTIIGSVIGIPLIAWSMDPLQDHDDYMKSTKKEEYYADLFAACYNVPLSFAIGLTNREYTINQISKDRLKKMIDLELKVSKLEEDIYPTLSERNYTAMLCAKNLLDSGEKLDPAIKEYCEWIVANYSNILDTDIGTKYQTVTFNPEEAKNLDEHIQRMISNNNIKVTESYIGKFRDVIIQEMSDNTLDEEISVLSQLSDQYARQCQFLSKSHVYQEGKIGDAWNKFKEDSKAPIKGRDDESILKKILMFIPRVLNAIIQAIARLFNKNDDTSMIEDMKNLQKQIDELSKSNEKNKANIKVIASHIVKLHNKINSGMDLSDEQYASIQQSINEMYQAIKKLGVIKVDKSVQIEQMRSVLTLSGYVLFTFDLRAYKKFMIEFDNVLKSMDSINTDNIDKINVERYNVSNVNTELDKHKGHFVYSIDDFERFEKEIDSMHKNITSHCKDLINKFNALNTKYKYGRNSNDKTYALNVVQTLSKRLSEIMTKLNNTQKWYREDFSKIRASINEQRNSITKLSQFNTTSYQALISQLGEPIEVDVLNKEWIVDFYKKHANGPKSVYIMTINRSNMQSFKKMTAKSTNKLKLLSIDFDTIQNMMLIVLYTGEFEFDDNDVYLIHYNELNKNLDSLINKELDGKIFFEQ